METIARPSLRDTSFAAYRIAVEKHLVPGVGKHRLDRLEPEHLERLYKRMVESVRVGRLRRVPVASLEEYVERLRRAHKSPAA